MEPNHVKVIIERNIPFIKGVLDDIAEVKYLAPEEITRETMADTDALITRTRTRCDASLLEGSKCRFIATATIGTDHIDLPYCESAGITVRNAPGCNAPAVAQYVMSVIGHYLDEKGGNPGDTVLGIVGVGHVGSIVERWARMTGFKVLLCDPPRSQREGSEGFSDFSDILAKCDIITFHTPLIKSGSHPTVHMIDSDSLHLIKRKPLIINSARGPVTSTGALLEGLGKGIISATAIDCWENEPEISPALLAASYVATPHIAGYSREGKIRATAMAVSAFTRHFGLPEATLQEQVPQGAATHVTLRSIMASYDPTVDTKNLKNSPESFEQLRNHYDLRHEVVNASEQAS